MAHFFEKRDRWGNGLALWVVAGMAFAIPVCVWSFRSISQTAKPAEWLPRDNQQVQTNQWAQLQFPHEESVIVSWEGSRLNDPRIKTFVDSVVGQTGTDGVRRQGLKQVQQVRTPQDLIEVATKSEIPEAEAIRRLIGTYVGIGSVKIRLTDAGRADKELTIERLKTAAADKLAKDITIKKNDETPAEGMIAVPLVSAKRPVAEGAEKEATEAAAEPALTPEHELQATWSGMAWSVQDLETFQKVADGLRSNPSAEKPQGEALIERVFLTPGTPIAVSVVLTEAGLADIQESLQLIKEKAIAAGIPEASLRLGGTQVISVAYRSELQKAIWNKAAPVQKLHERSVLLVGCLVGVGLSIWMLRSARLVVIVMGVAYLGVLYTAAFVPAIGGSVNILMLAVPAALLTMTLSGGIFVVNYWKQASLANEPSPLVAAVKRAQSPCLWASAITAIGCASLLSSTLGPIREFGIYSVIGSGISAVLVVLGIPALMQIWPALKPQAVELDETDWRNVGTWLTKRQKVIVPVLLVAATAIEVGLVKARTEAKPLRQFNDQARVVQDYSYLEKNLGGTQAVDLIIRFDAEAQEELRFVDRAAVVRRIEAELAKLPDVSGTLSLAKFLPDVVPLPDKATPIQKSRYTNQSQEIEDQAKGEGNSNAKRMLAVTKEATPFNAAGDELWRITARVSSLSAKPYRTLNAELDDICCSVLKNVAVHGTEKYHAGEDPVYYHPGASHIVAGLVPLSLAAQQELTQGLIRIGLIVCGAIGIGMITLLKNPRAGVLATIPITLPLATVCGAVSWGGLAIDAGTIAACASILGLSVSGTLHMLAEFRKQLGLGKSRQEAATIALAQCGPTVWQTSFIVGLGLFVLESSELQPISRFGWFSTSLVLTVLLTNIVLTPALLAGPIGYLLADPATEEAHAEVKLETPSSVATNGEKVTTSVNGVPLPRPHLESSPVMRVRRVE